MAVEFPNSPATNQIHSDGSRSWKWDGTAWIPFASIDDLEPQSVDLADLSTESAGTNGQILTRTATGMKWATLATPGADAVKAVYCGLRMQSLSATRFQIGPGYCGTFDGSDVIHVDSPLRIDFSAALLDTGTLAGDETYYVWLMINTGTGGLLPELSLSSTAPSVPHGHVRGRMVGSVETNADADGIVEFTMFNDGASKQIVTASGTTTLNLAV